MDIKSAASETLPAISMCDAQNEDIKIPTLTFEKLFFFLKELFKDKPDTNNNIYFKTIKKSFNQKKIELKTEIKLIESDNIKDSSICFVLMIDAAKTELVLIDKDDVLSISDKFGNIILHYAATSGNQELCKFLINHGCNIHSTNNYKETILYYAATFGNLELCEFLLEQGADINAFNSNGDTVLHYAINFSNQELCKFLLEHEADVNLVDENGNTPLNKAALSNHQAIVELLLEKGATSDQPDKHGNTPLHKAARNGNIELIQLLLPFVENRHLKNKHGKTSENILTELIDENHHHNLTEELIKALFNPLFKKPFSSIITETQDDSNLAEELPILGDGSTKNLVLEE